MKVAVIGASGGIGQPLSLLCKLRPRIKHLALADVSALVKGVALDIAHIPTAATVTAHTGDGANEAAVADADIVLIPAGVPRKPGMTREDLISVNASIVQKVARACAKHARKAMFGVISNPVNSTVPLFVETLVRGGFSADQAARSVFGITTLDALRARAFVAATANLGDPSKVHVPVVGGHAGTTIVPLFSQMKPAVKGLTDAQLEKLTHDTQNGGTYVVEAKGGAGSATLSMAQAGAEWLDVVMDGLEGKPAQIYSYVRTSVFEGCDYFAANCHVGKGGVAKVDPIGPVTAFEKAKLEPVRDQLTASIKLGIELAARD